MGKNNFISSTGQPAFQDRKPPKLTKQEQQIYDLQNQVMVMENFIARELLNDLGQIRNLLFAYLRLNAKPNDIAPEAVKYKANEAYARNLQLRCDELTAKKNEAKMQELEVNMSKETENTIKESAEALSALADEEGATMADETQAGVAADETEKTEGQEGAVDQAQVDAEDTAKAEEAAATAEENKSEE